MNSKIPTLAIYGIQDRSDFGYPHFVHDHSVALMHNGKVLKYFTLERLTRQKHDNQLHRLLYQLLKDEGVLFAGEFDVVFVDNVVGRSFISSCGRIRFEAPMNDSLSAYPEAGKCWWVNRERNGYALSHELAHIGSALPFCGYFKENSLLVHFDGGGSLSNFSAWHYSNNGVTSLEHHWDLKYLTSLFNANGLMFGIIGARMQDQNSVAGKLMGLASYGRYSPEMERWLKAHDYFGSLWGKKGVFFEAAKKQWGWNGKSLNASDAFCQDIAATFHHIFERDFLKVITRLQKSSKAKHLYLAGGCALNIVTNSAIVNSGLFQDVFIPPCTEDSGLALGAAAYVEYLKHGAVDIHSPYLNNWGLSQSAFSFSANDVERCAKAIADGNVVGVCNGVGEVGPRALGNRSLLARPDSKELAQKVSMVHKGREWYRPVAPVMLARNFKLFTGLNDVPDLSKYMLLDFEVLPNGVQEIAGVVHVNGTARIQCLKERSANPYLFDLLDVLDKTYGIRALINTSFNKRGEPIVHTSEDALTSGKIMNLDAVVVDGEFIIL